MTIHFNDIPENSPAMAESQSPVDESQVRKRDGMVAGLKKIFGSMVSFRAGGEVADVKGKPTEFLLPQAHEAMLGSEVIREAEKITRAGSAEQHGGASPDVITHRPARELTATDAHDLHLLQSTEQVTAQDIDAAIAGRQPEGALAEQPPEVPPSVR